MVVRTLNSTLFKCTACMHELGIMPAVLCFNETTSRKTACFQQCARLNKLYKIQYHNPRYR
jgi:hypothetical protein